MLEHSALDLLSISNNSCKFLLSMIDDILDLTKIELNQFALQNTWFKLEDTIKDVSDILGQQIKFKGLQLIVDFPSSIPKLIYSD